ncbi:hypothetical protein INT47_003012 [Mucor saturninus]|uniref:LITAF domain-containing protein n=1 Tax=Mucor saturninus TaxID=64648 RepID=A0A8H7QT36_9FUNG|nr:hypothetical protein INT47_003012 [Mucor saturninus]
MASTSNAAYEFSEVRSTPIQYSRSNRSSSEEESPRNDLCSVHSGRHGVFYFSTPLPKQKHEPYQYHGAASSAKSIKSVFSNGRSWRQKRMNIILKKKPYLPDTETEAFCEGCGKYITTRIRYRNGTYVWLMSFILLLCTAILFWIPFYVKYFKDVAHFCPGCGKRIGVSRRL